MENIMMDEVEIADNDPFWIESLWELLFEHDRIILLCRKNEADNIVRELSKYKYNLRLKAPELGLDGLRLVSKKEQTNDVYDNEQGLVQLTVILEEMKPKKGRAFNVKILGVGEPSVGEENEQ